MSDSSAASTWEVVAYDTLADAKAALTEYALIHPNRGRARCRASAAPVAGRLHGSRWPMKSAARDRDKRVIPPSFYDKQPKRVTDMGYVGNATGATHYDHSKGLNHMKSAATHRRNHSAFGSKRERQVAELLRAEGWVVFHNKASRGVCDLVAVRRAGNPDGVLRQGRIVPPPAEARLIEVKGTTRSPWVAWGPRERAELVAAAKQAGAVPMLAWWPPHGELQWLGAAEWPSA